MIYCVTANQLNKIPAVTEGGILPIYKRTEILLLLFSQLHCVPWGLPWI